MASFRQISRRTVLGAGGALTAASYSRILGANERINLGLVGCGNRGSYVMSLFQKDAALCVTALCDVYDERIATAGRKAPGAATFADHRKLLERKDVDAVLIGTPDHWHAEIAIDAMNAGKDVYVEKPLTFRREEGPRIIRAARMNNRICQVGLQQRSGPQYQQARDEFIKAGKLGRVTFIRSWWHGGLPGPLRSPLTEKPAGLDWARFLGQVRWREWNPHQYFHYRAFLDFGGGKITDLFTHWIDAIHMMLENDSALAIMASGGIYHPCNDGRDTPDSLNLTLEYRGNWSVTFDSISLPKMPGGDMEICGTEGRLLINRRRLEFRTLDPKQQPVVVSVPRDITDDHVKELSGLLPHAQSAELRSHVRASFDADLAACRAVVCGEAAHPFRSRPRDGVAGLICAHYFVSPFLCKPPLRSSPADLILLNGKIWTGLRRRSRLPKASRAPATGSPLRRNEVKRSASGRGRRPRSSIWPANWLCPDSTTRTFTFTRAARTWQACNCVTPRSAAEFRDRIGAHAAKLPKGRWITGGDWDHENWSLANLPVRQWIDAATADHPVFVNRLDGHMALANSAALKLAGITRESKDPPGGVIVRDASGEPTGILKDAAMDAPSIGCCPRRDRRRSKRRCAAPCAMPQRTA